MGIFAGTFGLFFTMVLLFSRTLPVIATAELKAVLPGAQPRSGGHHD
jgi:molybdopterin-containing oxidoreductase family membrane subunit